MSAWNQGSRIEHVRRVTLPKWGILWPSTHSVLLGEILLKFIEALPPSPVQRDMQRYYCDGEGPQYNSYGRIGAPDSRFYLNLMEGRTAFAAFLVVVRQRSDLVEMARSYGQD